MFSILMFSAEIADVICERAKNGQNYGVVLIPEGLIKAISEFYFLLDEISANVEKGVSRDEIYSKLTPWSKALFDFLPSTIQQQIFNPPESRGNFQLHAISTEVMIGALADMAQTGLYENAEKIILCLSGFISAIGTVMLPKVSRMTRMKQMDAVKRHIRLSMELVMCMVCAMAFGLAAVAVNFAPLFYGDDFAYSGTLMMPLAFTLLSIGFANVIRTQWVLPQGRDTIFVHSVLTGAVINLIANFVLIPPFGAMGAAAATVLAEFSVPAVQFVYLRKELPYAQYLKTTGVYCLFGLVMAGAVALLGYVLPLYGWGKLAVQVVGGAAVYGALCLTYWKLAKRSDIFRLMRRK